MKITGIIAEYNPFHTGHAYQLSKINADAIIAVMSGSFVQRGDVAVTDKWTRSAMAVKSGVDLVIELPAVFALATAQKFALGAVSLLSDMGIDELCFGSECGDIDALRKAAELLENEPSGISKKLKAFIADGMTYAAARERAYDGKIAKDVLSSPNNILAVEYMRALIRLNSKILPFTVTRVGGGYNELSPREGIASASAIREIIKNGGSAAEFTEFSGTANDISRLDAAITAKLRMITGGDLQKVADVSEGLENRILRAAKECASIEDIAEKIKTKRYTMSRIKRALICSLLGITSDMASHMPDYIRVLAMNKKGQAALREIKKRTALPIITKAADYKGNSPLFSIDVRATDIAALCEPLNRQGGRDFTTSPIII